MVINNLNINTNDYEEKLKRSQEYVNALEEERTKIQVFQRELPLCLELVTQAIEACKSQLTSGATEYHFNGQSECSEQISSEGPILEEFIPIKRASHSSSDEEQLSKRTKNNNLFEIDSNIDDSCKDSTVNHNKESKKSDWLRSVQLWNQSPDPTPKEDIPMKVQVVEVKKDGRRGAFHPFKKEKIVGTSSPSAKEKSGGGRAKAATASPSEEIGGTSGGGGGGDGGGGGGGDECKKDEKEGETQRKQRRCWSPELHKRFLQALQQLGGSHAATPKQIRELMKVDGLTNDEVKSHLQKYRLHARRPTSSMHNNNIQQAPQFVVVGGMWVPPRDYAAMTATPSPTAEASRAATPNGIYAPIPSMPSKQRHQQKNSHSEDHDNHSDGGGASHSPATSSSSETTTASPAAY